MLYLLLAIASSALVSIAMRLSEGRTTGRINMLVVNYITCLALAAFYMDFGSLLPGTDGIGLAVGLGLLTGLLYLLAFVLLQVNIRLNGVVMSATFMKLGLLVPMVLSIGLFGEIPSIIQSIGFLLAVAAIILINFEKNQTTMRFRLGLILLLLTGGGGDAMSKVFEQTGNPALSEYYLFYTFASALILCLALAAYKRERPGLGDLFFGLLVGIPNYFSARFLLKALGHIPAVIAYPTYSVATIITITAAGLFFFRETLSKRQKTAICIILAALVLLNI